jgi:pSer/pThr/pTyr-binding forkhead associated (FHA) protein
METSLNPPEHHILVIENRVDRVILLDSERYVMGRNDSNEIVLDHDSISREHAMLLRVAVSNEPRFIYRLMDGDSKGKPSTNGLFVNGQRQSDYDLSNDDVISFAGVINALYIKASMSNHKILEFMQCIASGSSAFSYSDNLAATQLVESFLSDNDPTSIMLGGLQVISRDTSKIL